MSKAYEGQDLNALAQQAAQSANSKTGNNSKSDSATESGIDAVVEKEFPGAQVQYGSAASGAGNNRDLPEGGVNPTTGKPYKAGDFEGTGGPEDKARLAAEKNPGANDVRENIR